MPSFAMRAAAVDEAATAYRDAIERVATAREGLLAARRDAIWTELYPSAAVQSEPPTAMLAGGIVSRLREAVPGLQVSFGVPGLRRLLEADVDFAVQVTTPDQKRVLEARAPDATQDDGAAMSVQTNEGQAALRRDREGARERYPPRVRHGARMVNDDDRQLDELVAAFHGEGDSDGTRQGAAPSTSCPRT